MSSLFETSLDDKGVIPRRIDAMPGVVAERDVELQGLHSGRQKN